MGSILLSIALFAGLFQAPPAQAKAQPPTYLRQQSYEDPNGTTLRYGLALPHGFDRQKPHALVLALHPGGGRLPYYGAQVMAGLFYPGLSALGPIMVAPDCPTAKNWQDADVEQAILGIIKKLENDYFIDKKRVIVTGYSMGARGTWFMEAYHPEVFTAAIVMAGGTSEPTNTLGKIPTYIIHSRADETFPFNQAEQRATELIGLGRPVKFMPLDGLSHSQMYGYVEPLRQAGEWVLAHWNGLAARR